jgi:flagellar hook assembly protein FlgD
LNTENNKPIPKIFALHQNYPNPFNPITTLRYDLPEQATVNIIIYDLLGRQVKSLINQTQDAGNKSVIWNATNDFGKPVSAGVYLYKIHAGEFVQTRKMVLLK